MKLPKGVTSLKSLQLTAKGISFAYIPGPTLELEMHFCPGSVTNDAVAQSALSNLWKHILTLPLIHPGVLDSSLTFGEVFN